MCEWDGPSVVNETIVRGRKEHRCVECKRMTAKGEEHELCKGCWDGELSTYRTCLPCRDLRNRLSSIKWKEAHDACWTYGGLAEDVTDLALTERVALIEKGRDGSRTGEAVSNNSDRSK